MASSVAFLVALASQCFLRAETNMGKWSLDRGTRTFMMSNKPHRKICSNQSKRNVSKVSTSFEQQTFESFFVRTESGSNFPEDCNVHDADVDKTKTDANLVRKNNKNNQLVPSMGFQTLFSILLAEFGTIS